MKKKKKISLACHRTYSAFPAVMEPHVSLIPNKAVPLRLPRVRMPIVLLFFHPLSAEVTMLLPKVWILSADAKLWAF